MKLLSNMQPLASDPELFSEKLLKCVNASSVYTVNTPASKINSCLREHPVLIPDHTRHLTKMTPFLLANFSSYLSR